ncbi:MAG: hypothetical protein AAB612_00430 [Patescibacteria group bacterium]
MKPLKLQKKISLKTAFSIWLLSVIVFVFSFFSLDNEFLLSDGVWIYTLVISFIICSCFLFALLKIFVKSDEKNKKEYFISTLLILISVFLIFKNYDSLSIALGLAQPFEGEIPQFIPKY